MNKANQLLDKRFMLAYLKKKVLPRYPYFSDIKSIKLILHKDYVWEGDAYHVVIEYCTRFVTAEDKIRSLPIFCSAHWEEPRKNVYDSLNFLWQHDFDKSYLTIPHPLFYSKEFRGVFYRGVSGKSFYHYIKNNDRKTIEAIIPKIAKWFAKLHNLNIKEAKNFNQANSRVETTFPGLPHIYRRIEEKYPEYSRDYRLIFSIINQREKDFFRNNKTRWLIHGDAHPGNVIKMGKKKIAFIDYTDICLSDFTRDIGTFMQQLEYMIKRKLKDAGYADYLLNLFIQKYFFKSKTSLDRDIKERIDNYYYWTTMRTATFFLLKSEAEPERARPLIEKVLQEFK
ncbi:MAG: phosphotransferase [Patescibacteria group bacterium]|nr:phosphotransferase [Patescibacteria group bacterium]